MRGASVHGCGQHLGIVHCDLIREIVAHFPETLVDVHRPRVKISVFAEPRVCRRNSSHRPPTCRLPSARLNRRCRKARHWRGAARPSVVIDAVRIAGGIFVKKNQLVRQLMICRGEPMRGTPGLPQKKTLSTFASWSKRYFTLSWNSGL